MKTIVIALAAATALSAGAASAQGYGYGARHWMPINDRLERLDARIDQGIQSGQLTRNEAYRLRSEFNVLVRLENRYGRNGLSGWERADLDRRFDALATQIRFERRDGDRRYGYNDRYDRYYPRY
jgi:hypothetical protein